MWPHPLFWLSLGMSFCDNDHTMHIERGSVATHMPPEQAAGAAPKRSKRQTAPQLLNRAQLDGRTNAAKFYDRLVAAIYADLGGADALSAIERALVDAFAGAAVTVDALNMRLLLGQEIDLAKHATAISAMVRVATRLGTHRRARDVSLDPLDYARQFDRERDREREAEHEDGPP